MGFKYVLLQIKIGDYERPILITLFYGAQNRRSEPSRFWFSFLALILLRIEARFSATFRSLRIGIVLYVRLLCRIIWNKERVACSWKRCRLVEEGALTLVIISRSSRCHITNILCPGLRRTASFVDYRILCVGFSPFGWERELVYYCLLGNCGTTVFLHLYQLSYAWTISRQIQQRTQ